jgi:DNA-binding response OmpR family regulator
VTTKGTILAVDDTHKSLKLLTDILTAEGYQVRPADSGELAIASVAASPPDLILLDIFMPGMNGFEVLRWLKAQEASRNIPVVFLSAATETKQRVEGLKLGAVDFITKPFQTEELLARVQTHMELRKLRVELEKQAVKLSLANEQLQCEIVERKKAEEGAQQKANVLQEAMNKIKLLSGLLPICSHCKKIRNEKGYWTQLEAYISEHSDTEFTHGICDECLNKLYPDYIKKMPNTSGEKE